MANMNNREKNELTKNNNPENKEQGLNDLRNSK